MPAEVSPTPVEIRLPARSPAHLLDLVEFWTAMDARMREMRDVTALPKTLVTRPDDLDDVVVWLYERVREQALAARATGLSSVEIVVPCTDELRRLIEWTSTRIDVFEGLVRAGMIVPDWHERLGSTLEFWKAAIEQIS